jgi:transcription antitermination factor NusG
MWKTPHPSEEGEALEQTKDEARQESVSPVPIRLTERQKAGKWFALYTTSRHEKRVAEHLVHRQIECYLPLYRSQRRWSDGSRVTLELPLFPGYLFIHIQRSERSSVLAVPGAVSVVGGTGGEPVSLPDATIDTLKDALRLRQAQPHASVAAGQRVRIQFGALAGVEGVVVRHKNGFRVIVNVEQIQQSYSVEVGLEDIEPIAGGGFSQAGRTGAGICFAGTR